MVGRRTSDVGVMLLSMAERRLGVAERLAGCFPGRRDPVWITHTLSAVSGLWRRPTTSSCARPSSSRRAMYCSSAPSDCSTPMICCRRRSSFSCIRSRSAIRASAETISDDRCDLRFLISVAGGVRARARDHGATSESAKGRYSPAKCTGIQKTVIKGKPEAHLLTWSAPIPPCRCTTAASPV
jgi:hypothetical protein